jgi:hypothetical protein
MGPLLNSGSLTCMVPTLRHVGPYGQAHKRWCEVMVQSTAEVELKPRMVHSHALEIALFTR